MWIRRMHGQVHVFASDSLSGRLAPTDGEWLTVETAIFLAANSTFLLPGVDGDSTKKAVNYSEDWRRGLATPSTGQWVRLPLMRSREEFLCAFELACDIVEGQFGVRPWDLPPPDRWFDFTLPSKIPVWTWQRALEDAANLVRGLR